MLVLAACSSVVVQEGGLTNPPLSDNGVVYLFAGLTPAGDTMVRSGVYQLTQDIRAAGVRAVLYNPSHWQAAVQDVLASSHPETMRIAVAGYSLGGSAATRFAERLRTAGVPVQTMVVLEAYKPVPVACNVRHAIDIYISDGAFALSTRLQPAPAFSGGIDRVNWAALHPNARTNSHLGVSKEREALRFVRDSLIQGGSVRARGPGARESACFATR